MIKKGSHLEGVEPINEKCIDENTLINILNKKLYKNPKALKYIKKILKNKKIYDKSGYSGNSVIVLKSYEKTNGYIIKVSKQKELRHEYECYKFFNRLNYTSKPLAYFDCDEYEVLIVEKINLLTAGNYFNSYKEIAKFFGEKLKDFHNQNFIKCIKTKKRRNCFQKKICTKFG